MDEKVAVIVVGLMFVSVAVYTIYSIRCVRETREVEQTKRELAAFVAEGSITPDDAVKMLKAGSTEQGTSMATIADGVAWGMISPAKGERLIRAIREPEPEPSRT